MVTFYRCIDCGWPTEQALLEAKLKARNPRCWCGSRKFKTAYLSLPWQIIFLVLHPSYIMRELIWKK